jgi:restriction endonuclease Mrr
MSVFCTASGVSGFERVTPADVEEIHSIQDGQDLKEFMRRWGDTNL